MTNQDRTIEHWETVAVTALPPGWRNVYAMDDGSVVSCPCPAILVQEHRYDERCWDVANPDGKTKSLRTRRVDHEPPYETRAVFAESEAGWLDSVDQLTNYVGTAGPDEDPDAYAKAVGPSGLQAA